MRLKNEIKAEGLYGTRDVAQMLDVSLYSIRALISAKELKGRRLGKRGHWFITGESLLRFIKAGQS